MVNNAIVVPVAVLAAISVAMFVFIWWWFPRHYRKGVDMDLAIMDDEQRQMSMSSQDPTQQQPRGPMTLEERVAIAKAQLKRSGVSPNAPV